MYSVALFFGAVGDAIFSFTGEVVFFLFAGDLVSCSRYDVILWPVNDDIVGLFGAISAFD